AVAGLRVSVWLVFWAVTTVSPPEPVSCWEMVSAPLLIDRVDRPVSVPAVGPPRGRALLPPRLTVPAPLRTRALVRVRPRARACRERPASVRVPAPRAAALPTTRAPLLRVVPPA